MATSSKACCNVRPALRDPERMSKATIDQPTPTHSAAFHPIIGKMNNESTELSKNMDIHLASFALLIKAPCSDHVYELFYSL